MKHFGNFAKVYANLSDYRLALMDQAAATGLPLMRPLMLHYANDAEVWAPSLSRSQYLFGKEFLVTPCVSAGSVHTLVYLPANSGPWIHLWSNNVITLQDGAGGERMTVPSSVGYPAVFFLQYSIK